MKAIIVDDEIRAVRLLATLLSSIEEVEIAAEFNNSYEALEYIQNFRGEIDILFLDVEMPGLDGISMAGELMKMPDPPRIVFVTGYAKYAYEAWEVEAVDYILKPYRKANIIHALERCKSFRRAGSPHKVEARCFPDFDLFVDGNPVNFPNKKAKELLAYLVHCEGKWVATGQIVYDIFGERDEEKGKKYYNVVSYRLRRTLAEEGISDLLEVEYGKCRVHSKRLSCDYYRYLEGKHELFQGNYMQQYSWAEPAVAMMLTKADKI
ncbi:response regulator [Lacrimispora sp. NSJ-141]|uniref:Stage 0 sporulation protein A homolog n=1 Tax=Lientehia hominis TaxID=2897778 RepID=A0AAP2W9H0_9FIRM|nr:response regulator [Lientehia hominis]MCD2493256.1 response regulator [Lientehia hominis]